MNHPFAILDSSIYINHWESERLKDKFEFARHRFLVRQCSVVLHELRRGTKTKEAIRLVETLLRNSPEILNPLDSDWWQTAQLLNRLFANKKLPVERLKNLQNDCLIAFCARRIGGVVITADRKDFSLLEKSLPCRVLYW